MSWLLHVLSAVAILIRGVENGFRGANHPPRSNGTAMKEKRRGLQGFLRRCSWNRLETCFSRTILTECLLDGLTE